MEHSAIDGQDLQPPVRVVHAADAVVDPVGRAQHAHHRLAVVHQHAREIHPAVGVDPEQVCRVLVFEHEVRPVFHQRAGVHGVAARRGRAVAHGGQEPALVRAHVAARAERRGGLRGGQVGVLRRRGAVAPAPGRGLTRAHVLSRDCRALSDNEHPGRSCAFVAIRCSAERRRAGPPNRPWPKPPPIGAIPPRPGKPPPPPMPIMPPPPIIGACCAWAWACACGGPRPGNPCIMPPPPPGNPPIMPPPIGGCWPCAMPMLPPPPPIPMAAIRCRCCSCIAAKFIVQVASGIARCAEKLLCWR